MPLATPSGEACTFERAGFWTFDQEGDSVFVPPQCTGTVTTGSFEQAYGRVAFSPLGDRIVVTVTWDVTTTLSVSGLSVCPWVQANEPQDRCATAQFERVPGRTEVYALNRQNAQRTLLGSFAGLGSAWVGAAEEGDELVIGEVDIRDSWSFGPRESGVGFVTIGNPQEHRQCRIAYRSAATAAVTGPVVASPYVCQGWNGSGTIAPVARHLSGPP